MPTERSLDASGIERLEHFLRSRRAELTQRTRATAPSEMEAARLDRLAHQIASLEDALERLGRRQYGWCHDCGTFIGLARLEALPFARRCRPCQSRAETDTDWLLPPA